MSKIGKLPVSVPSGVTVSVSGQTVEVKGAKGVRSFVCPPEISVKFDNDAISLTPNHNNKRARQMWGTSRSRVRNLVTGVTEGFRKELEINGVGYRAVAQGKNLRLTLGYSHDVIYVVPDDVEVKTPKPTEIEISGIDEQRVGQVAAEIRAWRPPEPYKGKGVKYKDEFIFRKEGKKK